MDVVKRPPPPSANSTECIQPLLVKSPHRNPTPGHGVAAVLVLVVVGQLHFMGSEGQATQPMLHQLKDRPS